MIDERPAKSPLAGLNLVFVALEPRQRTPRVDPDLTWIERIRTIAEQGNLALYPCGALDVLVRKD